MGHRARIFFCSLNTLLLCANTMFLPWTALNIILSSNCEYWKYGNPNFFGIRIGCHKSDICIQNFGLSLGVEPCSDDSHGFFDREARRSGPTILFVGLPSLLKNLLVPKWATIDFVMF